MPFHYEISNQMVSQLWIPSVCSMQELLELALVQC